MEKWHSPEKGRMAKSQMKKGTDWQAGGTVCAKLWRWEAGIVQVEEELHGGA